MSDSPNARRSGSWGRVAAWSLYDFANSPYSVIMTTIGFPLFFLGIVAPSASGPFLWGLLYGISEVIAAVLSPGLGALSDQFGRRKPFLIAFALITISGTALCYFLGPGALWKTFVFFGLANVGFACANVFYNALLQEVAPPGKMETVSGIGWGTGYVGGLLAMVLAMPLYEGGIGIENIANVRLSFLLVAGFFLAFSMPIFLLKERGTPRRGTIGLGHAYRSVWNTLKAARRYGNMFRYLVAAFFFNDGLNTVILFAGAYAKTVLNLDFKDIFLLFIYLQIVAAIGAYGLGWVADRLGSRRVLLVLVGTWVVLCIGLSVVQTYHQFIAGACVAGILLGATQAIARGYLAKLAPDEMEGEFFGFYSLAGKFAALVGPVLFGAVTSLTGQMRLGALAMVPLFLLGFFFLWSVKDGAESGPVIE